MKIETYSEPEWKALRKRILRRDQYLDQYLKRYGKLQNAEIVHHIFPVRDFPQYQLKEWNLISLSRATHNKMHDRDTDELTDIGKELLERTALKNNIDVPYWYVKKKGKKDKWKKNNGWR